MSHCHVMRLSNKPGDIIKLQIKGDVRNCTCTPEELAAIVEYFRIATWKKNPYKSSWRRNAKKA